MKSAKVILFIIFLYVLMPAVALSQTVDTIPTSSHKQLKELEVVGVKQMPSSEITPMTVITSAMVRRYNVDAMKAVSEIAPNFYMPSYGSRMTSSIYVRGLGVRIDQPIVGLSVDNVPIMNKDAYDSDMPDIDRIEVLRGAQSLLNGRNTMGGQINIHTISPWNFQGLRAMARYGRDNEFKAALSWYGLIDKQWATSVSGLFDSADGHYKNEYNGRRVDSRKSGSLRWKLCYRPNQWTSLTNVASATLSRQSGYPYENLDEGKIAYNDTCFYRRTVFSDGLTVAWAGKRVVVTLVTSAQYIDDNMTLDQDFTPADYFTMSQMRKEWAFTEDLFAKGARKNYSWLGGIFAFSKSSDMDAPVTFFDTGIQRLIEDSWNKMNTYYPIAWDSRNFLLGSDFRQSSRGVALYHESTYNLGKWTFQGGLRFDVERVSLDHHSSCDTGYEVYHKLDDGSLEPFRHTKLKINDRGDLSKTYLELLPKLSVSYSTGSSHIYASLSRAYKAGGFNTQMFSDVLQQRIMQYMGIAMNYSLDQIVSYKPEKSWNYEIGLKSQLFDNRMSFDATLFYVDCRDQQLTMFPPGMTTGRIMTNAGSTHSKGFELSVTGNPIENLMLKGSYGYTHATFHRFSDTKGDYAGCRLPYAPAQTLFIAADWQFPFEIAKCRPSVNVNVRGVGNIYWNEANTVCQPFYAMLGASATLASHRWSVSLWGENLNSARYYTYYFVSIGNTFAQRGLPWRAGVSVRFNFAN